MATSNVGPPPPDPSAVDTKNTKLDKVGGFLGAISKGGALGSISDAIERNHQKRVATAKMYHDVMTEKIAHPAYTDVNDPDHQKAVDEYNAVKDLYHKATGQLVDKETKNQIQQRTAIAEHHVGQQAQGGGQPGAQGASPAPSSQLPGPPSPGAQPQAAMPAAAAAATSPSPASTPAAVPPPPVPATAKPAPDMTDLIAGLPAERQAREDNRTIEMDRRKQEILTNSKIAEEQARAEAEAKYKRHLQHVPITDPTSGDTVPGSYDPDSGEYLDQQGNVIKNAQLAGKPFNYVGPNGEPLRGFMVGNKLQGENGKSLPPGTQVFSAWMQPLTTTTDSYRSEPQPDGTIKLVPVETTSTRTRGGGGVTPPPSTTGGGSAKPATSKSGSGGSRTVGGRVPTGVSKAYDAFNGSTERFNVMTKALEPALHGDQQAMINLLANHMGMTMGLQKGARMNQALIDEAQRSTPWLEGMKARFDDRGYLTGVTLTPDQMHKMIDLAKVRLDEDHEAWQREIGAAKTGYGMAPPPTSPKPSSGPSTKKGDPLGIR